MVYVCIDALVKETVQYQCIVNRHSQHHQNAYHQHQSLHLKSLYRFDQIGHTWYGDGLVMLDVRVVRWYHYENMGAGDEHAFRFHSTDFLPSWQTKYFEYQPYHIDYYISMFRRSFDSLLFCASIHVLAAMDINCNFACLFFSVAANKILV